MTPEKLARNIALVTVIDEDKIVDAVAKSYEAALAAYQNYRRTLNAEALVAAFVETRDEEDENEDDEQTDGDDSETSEG